MSDELEYLNDQGPLNQVQFSSKDFPTYFDALLRLIRTEYGQYYNDYTQSSVGVMLTHILSYGLSQLAWQQDRVASDCFLSTARTLDPVTRLARQIGYKVKPAAASSCDLLVTFDVEGGVPVASTINKGFEFTGPDVNGTVMKYYSTADVSVNAGDTTAVVPVAEGFLNTTTWTSNGDPNQRFDLSGANNIDTFVADLSVRVFVNGEEWTEVTFIDYEPTKQFEVTYTQDPPFIQFGDGFAGSIPASPATIEARWRVIHGASGNVMADTITTANGVFTSGGNPVPLTCTNPVASSGGAQPQSLESVKALAPQVFQSRGAAITQADYEALIMSFSSPTYGTPSAGFAACVRDQFIDGNLQALIDQMQELASMLSSLSQTTDASIDQNLTEVATELKNIVDVEAQTGLAQQIYNAATLIYANAGNQVQTQLDSMRNNISDLRGGQQVVNSRLVDAGAALDQALDAGSLTQEEYNAIAVPTLAAKDTNGSQNAFLSSLEGSMSSLTGLTDSIGASSALIQGWSVGIDPLNQADPVVPNVNQSAQLAQAGAAEAQTLSDTLNTQTVASCAEINAKAQEIYDYMVEFFSSDCHANLVECRILVDDPEGFYVAPSGGLRMALKRYLDTVKEVTQHVSVLSGADMLLPANIDLHVELNPAFERNEVLGNLRAGVDALLRKRAFNAPLWLSDVYDVADDVDGIIRSNIEILGYGTPNNTDRLDAEHCGNLVPKELEVVTRGTINIIPIEVDT